MHTILGINGTSGPGLAADLKKRGIAVRGVSRRPAPGDDWEHVSADVLDKKQVMDAVRGSEVVYLLVGLKYDHRVWQREWPVIMQNTIDACLEHGAKLVFMDNVYAYGLVNGVMTEDTPYRPVSKKGAVRVQIANMLHEAVATRGLRACIGRAADFYGPNCNTSVFNLVVSDRHKLGKKAFYLGNPKKIHTFIYTLDLGPALAILGTDPRADGQVWHLPTTAERLTGEDWVRMSAEAFGAPPGQTATPTFLMRLMGLFNPIMRELAEMNYQFTHDYIFSSEKFEKTFGMKPTSPRDGINRK